MQFCPLLLHGSAGMPNWGLQGVRTVVCHCSGWLWEISHGSALPRWELCGNIVWGSCDSGDEYPSPVTATACVDSHIKTPACDRQPHLLWGIWATLNTTTKRLWLWWASSQVRSSRRVKNIFSIERLNTPGSFCCSAADSMLQISGEWDHLATAVSLEKRNAVLQTISGGEVIPLKGT